MYHEDLLPIFLNQRYMRHTRRLVEFYSISDGTVAWIDLCDNLTQWHFVYLTEINGIDPLMVSQCLRQTLVTMALQSLTAYHSIFIFLYLFTKTVYLLVLDVLLELVSIEITGYSWKHTVWSCDRQFIVIYLLRVHDIYFWQMWSSLGCVMDHLHLVI